LCPALHLTFWILFMEAEFTAVVQAHERSGDEGGWPCANPSSSSSGFSRIIAPLRARQRLMRFYSCQVRCIGGNSLITCRVGNCTLLYPLHALFPKLELRSYLQSVVSIGTPLPSAADSQETKRLKNVAPCHRLVSSQVCLSFSVVRSTASSAVDAVVSGCISYILVT
jgi:hypothetical protein